MQAWLRAHEITSLQELENCTYPIGREFKGLSVGGDHLLGKLVEAGAVAGAGVEHVAARELVNLHAIGVSHQRHLVDGEDGTHKRAGEVVPAMHDEDAQLGVGCHGLAKVRDGSVAEDRCDPTDDSTSEESAL